MLPTGGHTVAGGAVIGAPAGNALTVTQTTPRAVVNWNSFSVGQPNTVTFAQPGSSAAILNRVTGTAPSSIAGQIQGNGQVYLVNPNGVAIAPTGSVQVGGGFVGSTLDITNRDFMGGKLNFHGNGASAPATNAGTISTGPGGYAALIGGTAANSGTISVPLGKVALGSGEAATLDLNGDGFLQVAAPTGAVTAQGQALVTNSGKINAPGGRVELKAATVAGAIRGAVNLSGVVTATSVSGQNGSIVLGGGPGGAVDVTGTLDASAPAGSGANGGTITVSGAKVRVGHHAILNASGAKGGSVLVGVTGANGAGEADSTTIADGATIIARGGGYIETSGKALTLGKAQIDAGIGGSWLTDPIDLTINATAATTIVNALNAGTNVTEQTTVSTISGAGAEAVGNGDLNVDSAIDWIGTGALTLSAYNDININAAITIGGAAQLNLASNNAGANSAATITVSAPITVSGAGGISFQTTGNSVGPIFTMGQGSATFSAEASHPTLTINGTTYTLVYSESEFDDMTSGNYALAAPLTFTTAYNDAPGSSDFMPVSFFFGSFNGLGNTISGLNINDNHNNTGSTIGLFGFLDGTVSNLGLINPAVFDNAGFLELGALAGELFGTVINSYAASTTTTIGSNRGDAFVGGLVGEIDSGSIKDSYASVTVSNTGPHLSSGGTGGLVGLVSGGSLVDDYATGPVTASTTQGGIAGGLAGVVNSGGTITNAYATGVLTGATIGGVAGTNAGSITNGYFGATTGASGVAGSGAGTVTGGGQESTANLAGATVLAGLNGNGAWANLNNQTTPYIATDPGPVFLGSDGSATPTLYNLVFTPTQLEAINSNLAGNYLLAQSLDLSSDANWTPIGNKTTAFAGNFDGLGNVVQNLAISDASDTDLGLFGQILGGTISNVGVGGSIAGGSGQNVGGLVGVATSGSISNSYATVQITEQSGGNVGGLVGSSGAAITNSYATGNVATAGTSADIGGLVGDALGSSGSSITDSYATGAVTSTGTNSSVGGLAGESGAPLLRVYAAGTVSASGSNAVGGLVGTQDTGGTITSGFYNADRAGAGVSAGVGSNSGSGSATGLTGSDAFTLSKYVGFDDGSGSLGATGNNWIIVDDDGTLNNASGSGATMPMLASEYSTTIANAHQLELMNAAPGASYTLAANIDATTTGSSTSPSTGTDVWGSGGFVPIGQAGGSGYAGTLDGAGHTITNLTITTGQADVGLVGLLGTPGEIENLGLVGGTIQGTSITSAVGALAGESEGLITNAYSTATVDAVLVDDYAGGLVGSNLATGTIAQSYAAGTVNVGDWGYGGGLVGDNKGTIRQSFAATTTNGGAAAFLGGLVGYSDADNSLITDSYAVGPTTGGSDSTVGGLVGASIAGTIIDVYATGPLSGGIVRGLVGFAGGPAPVDAYWDSLTTGAPTDSSGAVIKDTAGLQSLTVSTAFRNAADWGIVAGKSYPYLCVQIGGCGLTPQVVTGNVYTGGAGSSSAGPDVAVTGLIEGGTLASIQTLGGVKTGNNGYYYLLVAPNTFSSLGADMLTRALGYGSGPVNAAAAEDQVSDNVLNLALYGATLHEVTAQTLTSTVAADLLTALGSNSLPSSLTGRQIDASGNLTIDSALTVTSPGALTIDTGGTLTEAAGGSISASRLTGSAGGDVTLTGASNAVNNIGPFTVSGTGAGFALDDTGAIVIGGAVSAPGNIFMETTNPDGITIDAAVTGGSGALASFQTRFVQIHAAGSVNVGSTGTFELAPATTGAMTIGAGGFLSSTAAITAGTFRIGAVTLPGASTLTTTASSITVNSTSGFSVGTTATLDLETTGAVQGSGGLGTTAGPITAGTLIGHVQDAEIFSTGNAIGALGSFTASIDLDLSDGISLNVTGPVSAGNALSIGTSGTTAALTLSGNLTVTSGEIDLSSGTTITQNSGAVDPVDLFITSTGSVSMLGANTVDHLAVIITGSGASLTFNNTAHDLAVDNVSGITGIFMNDGNVTLSTTNSGNIALNQPIAAGNATVTLNSAGTITQDTSAGAITATTLAGSSVGGATFGAQNVLGNIGPWTDTGGSPSAGLTVNNSQALATAGAISSATGPVSLTTTAGDLTINNPISGTGFTATSAGTIFLDCATGSGGACAATPVVATSGSGQTYQSPVVVEADSTVTEATSGGPITFVSTVDAASPGGASLTLQDMGAEFAADVGHANPLLALSVTTLGGGTTLLDGNVTTQGGGQTYSGAVVIGGASITLSDTTGAIMFAGGVDALTAVAPGNALVVSAGGGTTLAAVGATTPLASLQVVGAATLDDNVTTTGGQDYQGPVTLGGAVTTLTTTTNGQIQFESTVDAAAAGGEGLVANANGTGEVVFQNAVGATKALSSFNVTGSSIEFTGLPTVDTAGGGQTYNSPVVINGASLLANDTASGAIDFVSTVDSASGAPGTLIADTGGTVTFGDKVGGSFPLTIFSATGGSISIGGPVTATGALSFISTGSTGGTGNPLTVPFALNAGTGTVTLQSAGTVIETSGGTVAAGTLTGLSVGGAALTEANSVGTFGPWTDSASGSTGIDFLNSGPFATAGAVQATTSVTLTAAGDLTVGTNAGDSVQAASVTLVANGGAILESSGAVISTPALIATTQTSGGAPITLTSTSNAISGSVTLSVLDASGTVPQPGTISFTDGDSFTIAAQGGAQSGITTDQSGTVVLTGLGTIGEGSGVISTGTLEGSSVGGATLGGANLVAALAGWSDTGSTAPAGFTLVSSESLDAGPTAVTSSGSVTLGVTGAGNTLTLDAAVQGTTVTLASQGAIYQNSGVITATNLVARTEAGIPGTGSISLGDANAATDITLTALDSSGTTLDSGGITYTSAGSFTIVGQPGGGVGGLESGIGTTGTVALNGGGAIGETGVVTAAALSGSSVGGASLTGTNMVGALSGFTNTVSGDVSFSNGETLQAGPVTNSAGNLTLTTTSGDISLIPATALTASRVTLASAGAVGGGAPSPIFYPTISAGSLLVTAAGGNVDLPGANTVGTVAANLTGFEGSFDLSNAQALTVGTVGSVKGITTNEGSVLIQTTAGNLTLDRPISTVGGGTDLTGAFAQIGLSSAGSLSQLSTGVILAASAELIAAYDIRMSFNNSVLNLAAEGHASASSVDFAAKVALAVSDQLGAGVAVGSMTMPGLVGVYANGGSIDLTGAGLAINEPVSANNFVGGAPTTVLQPSPGTVAVLANGGGDITESGPGVILGSQLYAQASGDVLLTGANRIGANDNGSGIAQTSGLVAGSAGGTFDLVNNKAGIAIATLGCGCGGVFAQTGDIALATTGAGAISVSEPLNAGNEINIAVAPGYGFTNTASNDTTFDTLYYLGSTAGLDTTAVSAPIVILADSMSLSGGTIQTGSSAATAGGVVLAPATLSDGIILGAPGSSGFLGLQTADLASIKAGFVQIGYRNQDGSAALTGNIDVAGNVSFASANVPIVMLVTGGSVTESGGAIAGIGSSGLELGVIAGGTNDLSHSNDVGTVAAYIDGTNPSFLFNNIAGLTAGTLSRDQLSVVIDGNGFPSPVVAAGAAPNPLSGITTSGGASTTGGIALGTTSGGLTIAGPLSAGAQPIAVAAAGAIAIDGTVTTTGAFSAVAGTTGGSAVAIAENASGDLVLGGSVEIVDKSTGGTITLAGNNAISGAVSLETSGTGADATLVDGVALTLAGATGGGNLTVTATGGLTVNGETTSPDTIALNAIAGGGSAPLIFGTGANVQAPVIDINATSISLNGSAILGVGGATIDLAHTTGGGSVTEASGAQIIASTLGATNALAGNVSLTASANTITSLSGMTVTGGGNGISITSQIADMTVGGALSTASGPVQLANPGGDLTLGAALSAPGNTVTLNAGGSITQTVGPITAGTLTASADGTMSLEATNDVATLGAVYNTGSGQVSFVDGTALQVTGPVSTSGPGITLTTTGTGSDIALAGDLTAAGGAIQLDSAGTVAQHSGVITAAQLLGASVGGAGLGDGNLAAQFGPWIDTGAGSTGIQFADAETVTTSGAISSPGPVSLSAIVDPDLVLDSDVTSGATVVLFANGNISQTVGTITGAGLVAATQLDSGGAISLNSATNAITGNVTLTSLNTAGTALGGGAISLTDASPFTIASAGGLATGIATAAPVTLVSGGDITLGAAAAVTGGGVVLAATGNFINESGSGAVTATGGNRWLIYSATSAGDTFGGLDSGNTAIWKATFATLPPASVTLAGNRYLFAQGQTLTVTTANLDKTYGQDASAAVAADFTVSGVAPGVAGAYLGDTSTSAFSGTPGVTSAGSPASASVLGGPYAITASAGTMTVLDGYALNLASGGQLTVNPATLTAAIIGNPSKVYDGTTAATLSGGNFTLTGFVAGEGATVAANGTYNSANVAGATTVTASLVPADFSANPGTSLSNYTLPTTATGAGSITPATLTAAIIGIPTKVYDGTTAATLNAGNFALTGFVAGEGATVAATGTYNSANVAGATTVTASLVPGDFSATGSTILGNYTLPTTASGAGSITPATLTASIIGNPTKVYDGTTAAALNAGNLSLTGFVAGEGATVAANGTYNSANVAGATTVTASLVPGDFSATGGTILGNYTLPTTATGAGSITPATLTASITGNPTKVYDGTTAAALNAGNFSLTGFVAGEGATVAANGVYNSANVAGATTVTASLVPGDFSATGGTILGNYTLPTTASGAGSITPATLTAAITGNPTKIYDGTTVAALNAGNFSLTGFVAGEGATVSANGVYNSADVAGAATVTASLVSGDFSATGSTILGNYTLPTTASGAGSITPATLTVTANDATKTYGAGLSIAGTAFTTTGLVAGDAVTGVSLTSPGAEATAAVSGSPYAITASAATGTGLANYTIGYVNGTLIVTPAALTVRADDLTRASGEGNPPLTYTLAAGELFNGDALSGGLATTASTASAAGTYPITEGTLSGGANYTLSFIDGTLTVTEAAASSTPATSVSFGVSPKFFIPVGDWPGGSGAFTRCNAATIGRLIQAGSTVQLFGPAADCGSF